MSRSRVPVRVRTLAPCLSRGGIFQGTLQEDDFLNIRVRRGELGHGACAGGIKLEDGFLGIVQRVVIQKKLPDIMLWGNGVPGIGGAGACAWSGWRRRADEGLLLHFVGSRRFG